MTLREYISAAKARLVVAGIAPPEAARDVLLLAMHALGWSRAAIHARDTEPPPADFPAVYAARVDRRTRREPMAYITGVQEFWNRDFAVSPSVLIPRPETELIIEEALSCAFGLAADIGTGSGCLAVTLAAEVPRARIVATDISPEALATARANAERHKVADRIEFREAAYLDGVPGPFDLIVANPPYVTEAEYAGLAPDVRDYEPRTALAAGADGLRDVREILARATTSLQPGGLLLMEIGYGQADAVRELVAATRGLTLTRISPDLQGILRVAVVEHLST
ncbi:MAG: protein-(glutamine-N5) methyltransferase, release factor-specific [Acidobacteria bacterium RIFCSPLOWO2_12_FULL_67_14b]|nr:MAG: protein-(glutamine-N5) methyltransferase, release factor-specific [Acidobacteria bacterium RIFCSPLOWO2_12_FULL_67_14b]